MDNHQKGAFNQKCSHKGAAPKACNTFTGRDSTKIWFPSTCVGSYLKPHFDAVASTHKLATHF